MSSSAGTSTTRRTSATRASSTRGYSGRCAVGTGGGATVITSTTSVGRARTSVIRFIGVGTTRTGRSFLLSTRIVSAAIIVSHASARVLSTVFTRSLCIVDHLNVVAAILQAADYLIDLRTVLCFISRLLPSRTGIVFVVVLTIAHTGRSSTFN